MNNYIKKNKAGVIVLIIGVVFMAMGVFRGETKVVLKKAIIICLECIGIG